MGLWRFVLSTSSFGDIRFTNHKMGEDYLYLSKVLNRTSQILTSSQIVYKYFYGGTWNLTSTHSVMGDMIGVIESIKRIKPFTGTAKVFRIFAIQKLTLSVLKNLNPSEKVIVKTQLLGNLISHPIYLLKLLVSFKFERLGYKDE